MPWPSCIYSEANTIILVCFLVYQMEQKEKKNKQKEAVLILLENCPFLSKKTACVFTEHLK